MPSRVIVAIRVAASAERAFEVFTAEIASWWKPNDQFAFTPRTAGRLAGRLSFEGRQGGRLIEAGNDGSIFEIGRILEWQPGSPTRVLVATGELRGRSGDGGHRAL